MEKTFIITIVYNEGCTDKYIQRRGITWMGMGTCIAVYPHDANTNPFDSPKHIVYIPLYNVRSITCIEIEE